MTVGNKMHIPALSEKIILTQDIELIVHDYVSLKSLDFIEELGDNFIHYNKTMREMEDIIYNYGKDNYDHGAYMDLYNSICYGENRMYKVLRFKAGIKLSIDRIYIRKGKKDFDSVTFRMICGPNGEKTKNIRFYVGLDQANKIYYEKVE